MTKDKIKVPCRNCQVTTNHVILEKINESGSDEYRYNQMYAILQCAGCDTFSFLDRFSDIDGAYPIDHDEWEVPEIDKHFPKFSFVRKLDHDWCIPNIVRNIYAETLSAIGEDSLILASVGLRATIEAVCNDQSISGKDLKSRISKMSSQGLISKKDTERLHGIRFLGNDAAHEIQKPEKQQIEVAIKIVQHLLESLYILKSLSEGNLDTSLSEYEEIKNFVESGAHDLNSGSEFPLSAILGKNARRVEYPGGLAAVEALIIKDIQSGDFTALEIGSIPQSGNASGIQNFKIP